jgi:hypothetical protein
MSARAVNWSLYIITFVLIATGVATIGTNRAESWWLYDAHRYAGALLCIVLVPKFGIILRAYARHFRRGTWSDLHTWAGLLLTLALLIATAAALVWTLNLAPFWVQFILYVTPLAVHWYLGLALVPFFLWHVWVRWVRPPKFSAMPRELLESKRTRRQALTLMGIGALGAVGLVLVEFFANRTAWQRRFTGSRVVAEFTGNDFPITHSETPPATDLAEWRLQVRGRVAQAFALTYDELTALTFITRTATIDCTLGWASTQQWRGIALQDLLTRAGWDAQATVSVHAATGGIVGLAAGDVEEALLATHVGDEPLSHMHGFPARLVLPSRRGYQWLKWVDEIVVVG